MYRPYVYERSATRAARGHLPKPADDYVPAARATIAAVSDLLRQPEAVGAIALVRHLGQAFTEAEGIVRLLPRPRQAGRSARLGCFWD